MLLHVQAPNVAQYACKREYPESICGNLLYEISAQSAKQFTDEWRSIFIYSFSTLLWFNVPKNQN